MTTSSYAKLNAPLFSATPVFSDACDFITENPRLIGGDQERQISLPKPLIAHSSTRSCVVMRERQ
jgi:hypothetical protein